MSSKAPPMNQVCSIVTVTRNRSGDYIEGNEVSSACHIRNIKAVRRTTNGETVTSDGQIWLPADSGAVEGSVVKAYGNTYQLERYTPGVDLDSPTIHFLKFDLEIIRVVS